ncbi:methyltransferase domain-containing protein [Actinopolymorpha sp. NPDC004070]|uniref:methyltransferase domain-containing protein n=1 Tax=Actinopolymorpha sp. NPDC004070 TaxID=3154548 RepID=UPI0033B55CDC
MEAKVRHYLPQVGRYHLGGRIMMPHNLRRPVRIATRMIFDPPMRKRYIAKLRNMGRNAGSGVPCKVCASANTVSKSVTYLPKNATLEVVVCRSCGHVAAPDNFKDYSKFTSAKQLGNTPRVGSEGKPGREYFMAEMAIEALGREDLSVLVCGPGRSIDYRRIAGLKQVKKVAIADLMKFFDDAEWVDLNSPVTAKFDIVICCEVVEHFTDPPNDFKKTLSYVEDEGVLVCSTNIYDGGNLEKQSYLFIRGHTSYYTPQALAHIARENDMFVDFRLPEVATTDAGGPRKRYLIFSRSQQAMQGLAVYFGSHQFAPSEANPRRADKAAAKVKK